MMRNNIKVLILSLLFYRVSSFAFSPGGFVGVKYNSVLTKESIHKQQQQQQQHQHLSYRAVNNKNHALQAILESDADHSESNNGIEKKQRFSSLRKRMNKIQSSKSRLKDGIQRFFLVATCSMILSMGIIPGVANAASRSGGRMGGSFRSSSGRSSSYRSPGSSRSYGGGGGGYYPSTRLYNSPGGSAVIRHSPSYRQYGSGTSTVVVGPSGYIIPVLLYGSVFYFKLKSNNMNKDGEIYNRVLGPGVSVMRLSFAIDVPDRDDPTNILSQLKRFSKNVDTNNRESVQLLVARVCKEILQHQSNIFAATSEYDHYSKVSDSERRFSSLSIRERSKFEQETVTNFGGNVAEEGLQPYDVTEILEKEDYVTGGDGTAAIVTIILSVEGNRTKPRGNLNSWQDIWNILSRVSTDVSTVDDCLLGAEVLWTPEERGDVITRRDVIVDYPDLRVI